MILLDTNLVSEFRKLDRGRADARVMAWAARQTPTELFISVMTIFELEKGVLLMERRDPTQGKMLRTWLMEKVPHAFERRILPVDEAIARRAAALHVPRSRPERDAMIAATALVHGMAVATRNTGDFADMGVRLIDPWRAKG